MTRKEQNGNETITMCTKFVAMKKEKDKLKKKLSDLNGEYADLEGRIVNAFVARGVQSLRVVGHTIYINRLVTAKSKATDKSEMIEALESSADTAWLVAHTCNTQSLGSWVRDLPVDPRSLLPALPEHVADLIEVSEIISARVRKGGAS